MKTINKNALVESKSGLWHIYTENEPDAERVIVRGEGIYVWDSNDKRYIDGISGLGVVNIGHGRQEVIDAMSRQLQQLAYVSPFMGFSNAPNLQLVSILDKVVPVNNPKFYFINSGSEAVERALMVARQYFIRQKRAEKKIIIGLKSSFHGSTFGCFSAGGLPNLFHFYGHLMPGYEKVPAPNCYRCEFKKTYPACDLFCASQLENLIAYARPENIAAFIIEPVMNAAGIIVPPKDYLPKIHEICKKNSILFIADEIVTGFGRTGKMFYCDHFGIRPDILTCAKGLSSGYAPISAAAISGEIADVFKNHKGIQNVYNSTFGGHPVACAAAAKNVEIMLDERLPEKAAIIGKYIERKLKQLLELPHVGDVRGEGCIWGIEIVEDKATRKRFDLKLNTSKKLEQLAYNNGLICRVVGDVIRLYPPLIVQEKDIDRIYDILYASIQELLP